MIVELPPKLLRKFKQLAKNAWPKEAYALLIGQIIGDTIFVDDLWLPPGQQEVASESTVCTQNNVSVFEGWWADAIEEVKETGHIIVGDIHSHPYDDHHTFDASPSEVDWLCPLRGQIQIVCATQKRKSGRFRFKLMVWPTDLGLVVKTGLVAKCHPNRPYLAKGLCDSCYHKALNKSRKDQIRDYRFKRVYGISLRRYNVLLRQQKNLCAICNEPSIGKELAIDHDHVTGHVRGLLCEKCNQGLGCFKDNIKRLRRAASYLKDSELETFLIQTV